MRKIGIPEIEDIATGAALLGAGGGGDPYVGKLVAIGAVQECGPVTLLDPEEVPDDALVVPIAMMGAPTVLAEKAIGGNEYKKLFDMVSKFFGREIYAFMPIEAGGVNSMLPIAAAEENLARFCEKAARADAYFARQAEQLLSIARLDAAQTARKAPKAKAAWRLEPLQGADSIILEAALHSLVAPVRDAEEKYIRLLAELVEQGSGAVQLTDTVRFCAGSRMLWQEEGRPKAAAVPAFSLPFAPADGAEFALPGGQTLKTRLFVSGFREKTQGVHKKDLKNRADYARITLLYSALTLRTRQPGDRFRPAGRGLSKPLRKWMNEAGIPAGIREGLPLLAAGSEILWVCGEGFAEGLAPDEKTVQILQLELENGGTTHEHE